MNERLARRIFKKFRKRPTLVVIDHYLRSNVRLMKFIHLWAPDQLLDSERSVIEGCRRVLAGRGVTEQRLRRLTGIEFETVVPLDPEFVFAELPWRVHDVDRPRRVIVLATGLWRNLSGSPVGNRAVILFTDEELAWQCAEQEGCHVPEQFASTSELLRYLEKMRQVGFDGVTIDHGKRRPWMPIDEAIEMFRRVFD